MKMKNVFKYIYIILFFVISLVPLGLFAANEVSGNAVQENIEKTEMREFPCIISDGRINTSFDSECEAWLNQNLPYRSSIMTGINVLLSDLICEPTANVITGYDGWIFSATTIDDYLGGFTLSDEDIRDIAITLSLIQKRVESEGSSFLFVPVPNKNTVYPEYMPLRYQRAKTHNLDRLYKELDALNVNYIDLKDELARAKTNVRGRLYYKRDTHWTNLGARIGYKSIMEKMGRGLIISDDQSYFSENIKHGDLDKLLFPAGNRTDEEYVYKDVIDYDSFEFIVPSSVEDTKAQLDNFMSDKEDHDNNIATKKRNAIDGSSLYMVRDSFARALLPYFIDSYDEAVFIRSTTPSFENAAGCDDVIYEICERNICNISGSAPYMLASEVDDSNKVDSKKEYKIFESELNKCVILDEGYAYRIFGTIDSKMKNSDGHIYVRLSENDESKTFEAFPIFEETSLQEQGIEKSNNASGYSIYIDKKLLDKEDYDISIVSGEFESTALKKTSEAVSNESEVAAEERIINPYSAENADHAIHFRDAIIGIGDNINYLKASLGDQAAPSEIVTSCLSGEDAVMYYYPDITIEADMNGNIYYISLMDNSYAVNGEKASTAKGIFLGSDKKEIWDRLGESVRENDKNCTYETEHINITYSYKKGKVTSVILEDKKYINEDASKEELEDKSKEEAGVKYESGNAYLYDESDHIQTGWQLIDGQYYFFDRLTGERIVGQIVDGIEIGEDGEVTLSDYEKQKVETMMKANKIMRENTNPEDTMEEKRRKVFDWVLSFPYHRFRVFKSVYKDEGIEIVEANDIFDEGAGDCVSESAALAFLFHEIGYNNVYWVHDTGHSWVRSDDRLFDPLFAESRDFDKNYDAEFWDYRDTMDHSMLIY